MQARSDNNLWGADVSHHNGAINWPKAAAAGLRFALIKASEGIGMVDGQLRRNALGADAVGIPAGFYHYAHPELNSASDEAENFVTAIAGLPCKLPLFIDVEGDAGQVDRETLTQWCDDFLLAVQHRTGARVGLYTGAYFARDNLGPTLGKYPLWIAHYGAETPLHNDTWPRWSMFQYSDNGSCPGIGTGSVDMNLMEADFYRECLGVKEDEPEMDIKNATLLIGLAKAAWREGVTKIELEDGTMQDVCEQDIRDAANAARRASGQPEQ
jgi:lysozyme